MRVEKKTFGQAPFWSSALISLSGAPASSGWTGSQSLDALLRTCQPPRPSVWVSADATPGSAHATAIATSRQNRNIFASLKACVQPLYGSLNVSTHHAEPSDAD